jgi:hypothetical protein
LEEVSADGEDELRTLELDFGRGEIRDRSTNRRMFLMNSEEWVALRRGLYDKFSSGASVILFDMGVSYGSKIISSLKQLDSKNGAPELAKLGARSGWGKVIPTGDLEEGSKITLHIQNCVFCGEDDSKEECNFLRGVSSAIASSLYGREYKSSTKCTTNGSHVCRVDLVDRNYKE